MKESSVFKRNADMWNKKCGKMKTTSGMLASLFITVALLACKSKNPNPETAQDTIVSPQNLSSPAYPDHTDVENPADTTLYQNQDEKRSITPVKKKKNRYYRKDDLKDSSENKYQYYHKYRMDTIDLKEYLDTVKKQ